MTQKQDNDRLLVGGTSLEAIAAMTAVAGIAISSLPITAVSIIPAGIGSYMLKKLVYKKKKEEQEEIDLISKNNI